jgi:hypothetical protein
VRCVLSLFFWRLIGQTKKAIKQAREEAELKIVQKADVEKIQVSISEYCINTANNPEKETRGEKGQGGSPGQAVARAAA